MGEVNWDNVCVEYGKWTKFEIKVGNSRHDLIWRKIRIESNKSSFTVNCSYAGGLETYVSLTNSRLPENSSFILKVVLDDSPAQYLSRSHSATTPIKRWNNFMIKCELLVYEHQSEMLPNKISDLKNCFEQDFFLIGQDGQVETTQALLYARSPVIRSMFKIAEKVGDEPMTKIKLIDYDVNILMEFVKFLESDKLDGKTSSAFQLLELGHKYEIKLLKKKAEQLVIHQMNKDNNRETYMLLCDTSPDILDAHYEDTFDKLQARSSSNRINLDSYKVKDKVARTLLVDIMEYSTMNMKNIVLVGSDGEITAKRELLMARSTVLRAIFKKESDEEQEEFKYEMKDYTRKVLSESWNFIINDEINPETDNALELLSLAHDYNITLLKTIATQIVTDNKKGKDFKVIYPVLARTNPDLMWNHFESTYEDFKKKSGLIDIDGKLFSKDENKFI